MRREHVFTDGSEPSLAVEDDRLFAAEGAGWSLPYGRLP
jgi:hypothetical protein